YNSTDSVNVSLALYGERNGVSLGSSLRPKNGTPFPAPADAAGQRGKLDGSPYFELPPSWLNGSVNLTLRRTDGGLLYCRENAQTPSLDGCPLTIYFQPVATLNVRFIPIRWEDDNHNIHQADYEDAAKIAQRVQAIFPIADLKWSLGGVM